MLQWSKFFQNPEFLERTRIEFFIPEYEPLIRKWCGLKNGSRVLDVACGTGAFTRLLKRGEYEIAATGVDIDETFIARAKEEAKRENLDIEFVLGDAMKLPFEDSCFDVVVSQTFLTSATEPEKVFSEMKRVLKPGGRIASMNATKFVPEVLNFGTYTLGCSILWAKELMELYSKLCLVYEKINPISGYATGLKPSLIPNFFAAHGMKNVCAYSLGRMFSLSNAAISHDTKQRWLDLYYSSEKNKLAAYMELPEFRENFTQEEAERYMKLLRMKCDYYIDNPDENEIWEFVGGSNMLITGDC